MKRVLYGAGIVLAVLAFVAGMGYVMHLMNEGDKADAREQKAMFDRANTICGGPPRSIKTHGSGWSYGRWIEVTCKDGTKRAVR